MTGNYSLKSVIQGHLVYSDLATSHPDTDCVSGPCLSLLFLGFCGVVRSPLIGTSGCWSGCRVSNQTQLASMTAGPCLTARLRSSLSACRSRAECKIATPCRDVNGVLYSPLFMGNEKSDHYRKPSSSLSFFL